MELTMEACYLRCEAIGIEHVHICSEAIERIQNEGMPEGGELHNNNYYIQNNYNK